MGETTRKQLIWVLGWDLRMGAVADGLVVSVLAGLGSSVAEALAVFREPWPEDAPPPTPSPSVP